MFVRSLLILSSLCLCLLYADAQHVAHEKLLRSRSRSSSRLRERSSTTPEIPWRASPDSAPRLVRRAGEDTPGSKKDQKSPKEGQDSPNSGNQAVLQTPQRQQGTILPQKRPEPPIKEFSTPGYKPPPKTLGSLELERNQLERNVRHRQQLLDGLGQHSQYSRAKPHEQEQMFQDYHRKAESARKALEEHQKVTDEAQREWARRKSPGHGTGGLGLGAGAFAPEQQRATEQQWHEQRRMQALAKMLELHAVLRALTGRARPHDPRDPRGLGDEHVRLTFRPTGAQLHDALLHIGLPPAEAGAFRERLRAARGGDDVLSRLDMFHDRDVMARRRLNLSPFEPEGVPPHPPNVQQASNQGVTTRAQVGLRPGPSPWLPPGYTGPRG